MCDNPHSELQVIFPKDWRDTLTRYSSAARLILCACVWIVFSFLGFATAVPAAEPESAVSDQLPVSIEQSEPEGDLASGGALANSFRYLDGVLVGTKEDGAEAKEPNVAPLAFDTRSVPNTWQKQGNDYVVVNGLNQGMRVTGAKGFGIDVSVHQGVIDWSAVKHAGIVDYAIIRCGWGSDYSQQDDQQFINNVKGCMENGIPFGVYIYSYAYNTSMALSEANHVLRMLNAAGLTPQDIAYPIYYDLENEAGTGRPAGQDNGIVVPISNEMLEAMAQTFCTTIEDAGYYPGVYANKNWWTNYLTGSTYDQWSKWVAEYDYSCTYAGNYDMWQCMSDGTLPGIATNVDINFDYGAKNDSSQYNYWYFDGADWLYLGPDGARRRLAVPRAGRRPPHRRAEDRRQVVLARPRPRGRPSHGLRRPALRQDRLLRRRRGDGVRRAEDRRQVVLLRRVDDQDDGHMLYGLQEVEGLGERYFDEVTGAMSRDLKSNG